MVKKIWEEEKALVISCGILFVFMLIMNILTPLLADDYAYKFSFATGERISGAGDIVSSMKQHYYTNNGRLLVHFLVSFFLMLPPILFDIVNAVFFLAQIFLLCRYSFYGRDTSKGKVLVFWTIFAMFCSYVPVFGQVYLWEDGSCNYLWPVVAALLYLIPFHKVLEGGTVFAKQWQWIAFVAAGVLVGATLESVAFGVMLAEVLIMLAIHFIKKQKRAIWMYLSLIAQLAGYIFMIRSPGTMENKFAEGNSFSIFLDNFYNLLDKYRTALLYAFIFWILLFVFAILTKCNINKIIFSAICVISSLAMHFAHIPAAYFEDRCMLGGVVFLIMGVAVLLPEALQPEKLRIFVVGMSFVIMLVAFADLLVGVRDIYNVHVVFEQKEESIESQKSQGLMDVTAPCYQPATKFSGQYGLGDLGQDASYWINIYQARYYEVNSIVGQ